MNNNGVSCLCLTYGRPHLLEEAIESFLKQEYDGQKELIIVNDHENQILKFDHPEDFPEVKIFNIGRRLRTLGEKRNLSVALAKYDNLFIWDDDDIYLPWRISETMKTLPKAQFFKCPNAWVMNDGKIDPKPGYNLFHGGTAFTRWLWEQVGGYSPMNGGEDADIEKRFQEVGKNKEYWPHTELSHDKLYYIYRWSHGSFHTTGHTTLDTIDPKIYDTIHSLSPHWKQDYISDAASMIEKPKNIVSKSKSNVPINFICFSKNRPLQLDGYIRSFKKHIGSNCQLSVLYTCDNLYQKAYDTLIESNPEVDFRREKKFAEDILSLWTDHQFVCFGCDDVIFTGTVDIASVVRKMMHPDQFAFSLRLGKNIKRSMFGGSFRQPECIDDSKMLTWDLHTAHAFGDFGYSWEMDGTVYPADIAMKVIEEVNPSSPNILEAHGGGKWSSKTSKKLMSCFAKSKLVVPTVNVVQSNFPNPVIGKKVTTEFLLDAWNNGMRMNIDAYENLEKDCIHIQDLHLNNL